ISRPARCNSRARCARSRSPAERGWARPGARPTAVRSIGYGWCVRIYFVGSHATGKTTLCRHVSRRYGVPMITEVARAVLAEMETGLDALRTDMDLVAEYQERVIARQVAVERQHADHFVSDRAFDNLAYVAEHTTNAAAMMN